MNGIWKEFKAELGTMFTVIVGMLSSVGVSFFCMLGMSGLLLRVPYHFHGLTRRMVLTDYYKIVGYLCGFGQSKLRFNYLPMSRQASQHFADVQGLIHGGEIVTIISLLIFWGLFRVQKKRYRLWQLISLYKQLIVLIGVIAVLIVISFQDSFLWFHEHVFDNENWVFNVKTDPIILLLNQSFFTRYFVGWFFLTILIMWGTIRYCDQLINFFTFRRRGKL